MTDIKVKKLSMRPWQITGINIALLLLSACAEESNPSPQSFDHPIGQEEMFASPEQAAQALADANRRSDIETLHKILGPNSDKIISSGDPIADQMGRDRFVKAYDIAHRLESDGQDRQILVIGSEEWPLPIPLVRVGENDNLSQGWQFDTEAGEQEILNRRVGRNELNVIKTCRAYVEAQREYAEQHHTPDGKPEYAQHFMSHNGRHDGLYWAARTGESMSPLGPMLANARAIDATTGKPYRGRQPYHGYFYKILRQQGASAAGGEKNYVVKGHMTEGFALIAFPAKYGDSGIMTFMIDQTGIVFEKDLGPDTFNLATKIKDYDPDQSWEIAFD